MDELIEDGITGYLYQAIAQLEEYKSQLPTTSNEYHQVCCALRHAKKTLVVYSLTQRGEKELALVAFLRQGQTEVNYLHRITDSSLRQQR